jgi:hypothetical protein
MFSTVRAKVNGLDEKQEKYVTAILAGRTEAATREITGYKAAPKALAVFRAIEKENVRAVGEFSDVAKNYAFRLAIERISGEPLDEGYQNFAIRRGHELASGLFVERAGFVMTEDGVFGASTDGLIGSDEGTGRSAGGAVVLTQT